MNTPLAGCAVTAVSLLAAAFLCACSANVSGPPFDPARPVFPTTQGNNLNKRAITIPAGLDAPFNILIVAFEQRHQQDVDTWLDTAKQIAADHANVEYYELPTVFNGGPLFRVWLDGGMRSGILAFASRERTVTVYTDTTKFRELAGIEGSDQIWIGLVDRAGRVYWSARGPATAESLVDLRKTVRTVASPEAP